jgi:hypothetical protein
MWRSRQVNFSWCSTSGRRSCPKWHTRTQTRQSKNHGERKGFRLLWQLAQRCPAQTGTVPGSGPRCPTVRGVAKQAGRKRGFSATHASGRQAGAQRRACASAGVHLRHATHHFRAARALTGHLPQRARLPLVGLQIHQANARCAAALQREGRGAGGGKGGHGGAVPRATRLLFKQRCLRSMFTERRLILREDSLTPAAMPQGSSPRASTPPHTHRRPTHRHTLTTPQGEVARGPVRTHRRVPSAHAT